MSSGSARKASLSVTSSGLVFPGQLAASIFNPSRPRRSRKPPRSPTWCLGLANSPRLFVRVLGAVGGIITMSDLQKPPVRMWLFGMITLLEMRTSRLIELKCPGDSWKQYLSESRLQKAEALLEERKRRNQNLELIDCLQISDKGQIIARNEEIRRLTRMQSRRQTEQVIKMLESLRNNLAHSQDIISCDWETIVRLCKDMERVISGTEEVQQALAEQ